MQSSSVISFLVSGTADYHVQERVKEAERAALIRSAQGRQSSVVRSMRELVGRSMVVAGKWIAGRPRRQRQIDVPAALKIAR